MQNSVSKQNLPHCLQMPGPLIPSKPQGPAASGTRAQDLSDILSLRKLCSRRELLKVINSSNGSPCWERRKHVSNMPGRGGFRKADPLPHWDPPSFWGFLQPMEREVTPQREGIWEAQPAAMQLCFYLLAPPATSSPIRGPQGGVSRGRGRMSSLTPVCRGT